MTSTPRPLLIFPCNGNAVEALDCLGDAYRCIGFVEPAQIVLDLAIEARSFLGDPCLADNPFAARHRSELRAIQGDQPRREQPRVPA